MDETIKQPPAPKRLSSERDGASGQALRDARSRARRRRRWLKRALVGLALLAISALVVFALLPSPIAVDVTRVERGSITVSLLEKGKTRVRDRYVVRAPIAGDLERIAFWPGDEVKASEVVARLRAVAPPLLGAKERRLAEARLAASRAALSAARNEAVRANLTVEKLAEDLQRVEELVKLGAAADARVIDLRHAHRDAVRAAASSKYQVNMATGERQAAEATLGLNLGKGAGAGTVELRAPVSGTVLRVPRRDRGPVGPGEPLVELGSLASLEVVIDVLTADAVSIPEKASVQLRGTGDSDVGVTAIVSHVEPMGFTRLSALGVEEQRVNVIARFAAPPPIRLGDAFGVDAEIIVAERRDTLVVPLGSLFRRGDSWVTYQVDGGRARLTPVTVGKRGDFSAEILAGLEEGAEIVLHPNDDVVDGIRVEPR